MKVQKNKISNLLEEFKSFLEVRFFAIHLTLHLQFLCNMNNVNKFPFLLQYIR